MLRNFFFPTTIWSCEINLLRPINYMPYRANQKKKKKFKLFEIQTTILQYPHLELSVSHKHLDLTARLMGKTA